MVCLSCRVGGWSVAAFWAWLGAPIAMPHTPLTPGEKLYCLSYAPFRDGQTPFDPAMRIPPEQIDDDLTRLAKITDCVRTYSVELGQDQVAAIARRHGLKVIQGIWLGVNPEKNRAEIETAVKIANEYPDVVRALVVGNEVLLRGDLTCRRSRGHHPRGQGAREGAGHLCRRVGISGCAIREVAAAVDFITIHILPYWEDFPIPARKRPLMSNSIRRRRGGRASPARK